MPAVRLLAAGLAVWLAGCSAPPEGSGAAEPSVTGPAPATTPAGPLHDVLLITIDTLRADAPGFAGNPRAATPVLDRLAAAGRVFDDAHAHSVVTLPSHTNILTGRYPFDHGVRDNRGYRLPASIPTAATLLRAAGFRTAAFVGAFPLDARFGLARGFEVYDDAYPLGSRPAELVMAERRGDAVVRPALAWWREHAGERRFLWVHLFDPHAPYDPPEPFATRFADAPYLGEVAAADAFLAPLLEPLLAAGTAAGTMVVLTADHGEALGEHGELTHGLFAYEPTLHVPLVLWGRGVAPGRDHRPARHVDLLPTILQAAEVDVPDGLAGRSLLRPWGDDAEVTSYFEAVSTFLNRGWAPLRGMLRGGHKWIELPVPELYDLGSDPHEGHNLAEDERRRAASLRALLPAGEGWPPGRGAVSAAEEAGLRSLGYLGGSGTSRTTFGPADDPKNLIHLDGKIHRLIDLYSRHRLDAALPLARELVAERPSMSIGHSLLAQVLLERGERQAAIAAMQRAVAEGAASEPLRRQLGLTLAEVGRAAEAVELLRPLAADGEPETLDALGLALSEAGRQGEAQTVLGRALAVDPDHPRAREHLGLVFLRLGRWAEARRELERAVGRNPELATAWNSLGVALYQLGDHGAAFDAWQRAVDLDPAQYDTLYNIGFKAAEEGRLEQARRALERFVATAPAERYGPDLREARALLERLPR